MSGPLRLCGNKSCEFNPCHVQVAVEVLEQIQRMPLRCFNKMTTAMEDMKTLSQDK